MKSFNFKLYSNRINYVGSKNPNLETLNDITLAHTKAIPFENIDVALGLPIGLNDETIFEKLVSRHRGGYCFEQNSLLMNALLHLGFEVSPLSARVRLQTPRDRIPPRTHLFLKIRIADEDWLTDVGVGAASLTSAIKLELNSEQKTSHDIRRIVKEKNSYFHQIKYDEGWHDVCEFTLEEMPAIDRELANWFTSAHPDSHFRNRLVVAKALDKAGRVTLLNDVFTIREGKHAQKRNLCSNAELLQVLADYFGLYLDKKTEFKGEYLPWVSKNKS